VWQSPAISQYWDGEVYCRATRMGGEEASKTRWRVDERVERLKQHNGIGGPSPRGSDILDGRRQPRRTMRFIVPFDHAVQGTGTMASGRFEVENNSSP
jgi:hypothetical protein